MIKTRKLAKARAVVYAKKAAEFERAMEAAAARGDWNAVGLTAVHAVISAADAITVFYLGERAASNDHAHVVTLLAAVPIGGSAERAKQVAAVIAEKNVIEYEDTDFSEKAARRVEKQARRVVEWMRGVLRPEPAAGRG